MRQKFGIKHVFVAFVGPLVVDMRHITDAPYIGGEVHIVAEFDNELMANAECDRISKD